MLPLFEAFGISSTLTIFNSFVATWNDYLGTPDSLEESGEEDHPAGIKCSSASTLPIIHCMAGRPVLLLILVLIVFPVLQKGFCRVARPSGFRTEGITDNNGAQASVPVPCHRLVYNKNV